MNFANFPEQLFYRTPPGDCFKSDFSDLQAAARESLKLFYFTKFTDEKTEAYLELCQTSKMEKADAKSR